MKEFVRYLVYFQTMESAAHKSASAQVEVPTHLDIGAGFEDRVLPNHFV